MMKNSARSMTIVICLSLLMQVATVRAADESRPPLTPRLLAEIMTNSAREVGRHSDTAALLPDILKDKHFLRLVTMKLAHTAPSASTPTLDDRGKAVVEYVKQHGYTKGAVVLDDMTESADGNRTYSLFDETGGYSLEVHQSKAGQISVSR